MAGTGAGIGTVDRIVLARELYERATFGGDSGALATADRTLDAVEADLALARGRVLHARYLAERIEDPRELELFERAAELYRQLGDVRGEAEAVFLVGCVHQVVRGDGEAAAPAFARARELATLAEDTLTLSYVLRHLAFGEWEAGRTDDARALVAESTRLRRELDFRPGVAANLLTLAQFTAGTGDLDGARDLLDEAAAVAGTADAHGVLRWVAEARAAIEAGSREPA